MDATPVIVSTQSLSYGVSNSGHWVDQGESPAAWFVHTANSSAAEFSLSAYWHAIGLLRADGSDRRLLLHTYSEGDDYYRDGAWGHQSQDGRVVLFKSNMNQSGRMDAFIAILPTAQ